MYIVYDGVVHNHTLFLGDNAQYLCQCFQDESEAVHSLFV